VKTKDLHAMTLSDLEKQLKTSRQELFNLRFQMATGQLENHRQIRLVRRDLAQILTEILEKESALDDEPKPAPVAVAEPEPAPAAAPASAAPKRAKAAPRASAPAPAPRRRSRTPRSEKGE